MEQYLKPGYRVRPKSEPPKPGRPKILAVLRSRGVKASLEKMRQMSVQGYDTRQIGLSLIKPCMGRRMRSKKIKMSLQENYVIQIFHLKNILIQKFLL